MYKFFKIKFLILCWMSITNGMCQVPIGTLLQDTITTGETFTYALTFKHSPKQEVFFPDSTFDFRPFKFVKQEIFTTVTDSSGSLDSTIYHLSSFEITPFVTLQLPIYLWNSTDCTAVYPTIDSAIVELTVNRGTLDTLQIAQYHDILPVKGQINYTMVAAVAAIVCLLLFGIYWIFGAQIDKQWRVFQLRRRYNEFYKAFNRHYLSAKNKESIPDVETALILWKKYLEKLEKKPFTTFTTKEISDNIPDQPLRYALSDIDEIIYGFTKTKDIGNSLLILNNIAQKLYIRKRREIISSN